MRLENAIKHVVFVTLLMPLLSGCGKSKTPPRIYVAATAGTSSVEDLVDAFKKAYAARDVDAAMQMFHWQSADMQDSWWVSLNDMFAIPYDAIEVIPPQGEDESAHPPPKTTLPVVARLRITTDTTPTSQTVQTLLIGENENGFYFTAPVDE